jgi:hypothetical protein
MSQDKLFNDFQEFIKKLDEEKPNVQKKETIIIDKKPTKIVKDYNSNASMKQKLEQMRNILNNDGDYKVSVKKPKRVASEKQLETLAKARETARLNRQAKLNQEK